MGWLSRIFFWIRGIGRLGGRLFTMLKGSRYFKWLFYGFLFYADKLVGKIMMLLGVSFVVNKFVTPSLTSFFLGKFAGLNPVMLAFVGMLRLDQAITVIMSAAAIAAASSMRAARRSDVLNQPL